MSSYNKSVNSPFNKVKGVVPTGNTRNKNSLYSVYGFLFVTYYSEARPLVYMYSPLPMSNNLLSIYCI